MRTKIRKITNFIPSMSPSLFKLKTISRPDVDINGVEDGFFHFNPTLAHDDPDDLIFNPRPELP